MGREERSAGDILTFPTMRHGPGSIGFVEKMIIGELLAILQPRLIIETGALQGHTTRYLAEFIERNGLPRCRIVSFDFPAVIEEIRRSDAYLRDHELVEFVAGELPRSLEVFAGSCSTELAFAIVDAAHEYASVREELRIIDNILTPGGYVFCHDYRPGDARYDGVICAVNDFAAARGYELLELNPSQLNGAEVVWGAAILRKPSHRVSWVKGAYHRTRLAGVVQRLRRAGGRVARAVKGRGS